MKSLNCFFKIASASKKVSLCKIQSKKLGNKLRVLQKWLFFRVAEILSKYDQHVNHGKREYQPAREAQI